MNAQAVSEWNVEIQRRRTVLLDHLLLTAIVGGVVAMVSLYIGMPQAMSVLERLVEMAPFLASWLVTLIAWAWRGLSYHPRALILLSLTYVLGIIIFARGGLPGSGRVWLLLLPAVAPVLLGPRWGIAAGAVSALTYAFFTVAISQKWVVPQVHENLTALAPLLSEGGAFLLVAVILTLILWSFSRSWLQALAGADAANRRLQAQTRELEETNERLRRQTSQLQATAEIARAGSSTLDPDKLLTEAVKRIQAEFSPMGVHCVGLFLLDEAQRSAVLRAASGEAGQSLLSMGYAVELDETSTVGRCITHRQACTALDVGEETAQSETLTTPRACSEIALPLRSRGRVLGALSVQSTQEPTLSEADIAVLQAIADQVAVAIDNAVLFSQTEAALEELQAVQRRYQAQAWREFLSTKPTAQVDYTQPGAERGDEAFLGEVRRAARVHGRTVATSSPPQGTDGRAAAPQAALVVPLKLWGQVIGTMTLHTTDQRYRWTAEGIALTEAVAEQATLTVENLRLMDETQRRAARERLTREITDKMRRATSVEDIVQTAADELFDALGASRTFVRLGTAPPAQEDGEADLKPQSPNLRSQMANNEVTKR
jgi:GAF domain-containing protein